MNEIKDFLKNLSNEELDKISNSLVETDTIIEEWQLLNIIENAIILFKHKEGNK